MRTPLVYVNCTDECCCSYISPHLYGIFPFMEQKKDDKGRVYLSRHRWRVNLPRCKRLTPAPSWSAPRCWPGHTEAYLVVNWKHHWYSKEGLLTYMEYNSNIVQIFFWKAITIFSGKLRNKWTRFTNISFQLQKKYFLNFDKGSRQKKTRIFYGQADRKGWPPPLRPAVLCFFLRCTFDFCFWLYMIWNKCWQKKCFLTLCMTLWLCEDEHFK